ncbi:MAG: spore maturation protein [Erysipelotrichaceae bacterium]|nr:spore maturation protein [Erysipelotrichaceae bacterium]
MINYIFGMFIIIGVVYSFLTGNSNAMNDSLISSGSIAIEMVVKMIPLLCLWLGVMKIAEESGLLKKISILLSKIIHPLFPELKRGGEAISYIASNMAMNMLGLGNAATPFGLKAMDSMQKENSKKDTATRSMITFLVLNTASITLIPTTVISFRNLNHSKNPTEIIGACLIATILSCLIGLILDRIFCYIWRKKYD